MKLFLSHSGWGRSCLHLAAALRGGHWHWHLAGIRREFSLVNRHLSPTSPKGDKRRVFFIKRLKQDGHGLFKCRAGAAGQAAEPRHRS